MLKYKNCYKLLAKGQVATSTWGNCLYWSCEAGDIQTPQPVISTLGIIPLDVLQYIAFSVSLLFGWHHGPFQILNNVFLVKFCMKACYAFLL